MTEEVQRHVPYRKGDPFLVEAATQVRGQQFEHPSLNSSSIQCIPKHLLYLFWIFNANMHPSTCSFMHTLPLHTTLNVRGEPKCDFLGYFMQWLAF